MTNYEWVKENRKEVIRESLHVYLRLNDERAVNAIIDGDDVIKEAICGRCSVDLGENNILLFEIPHNNNSNYLVTRSDIMKWLDKEHEVPLLYPIGTALIKNDTIVFYNGISRNGDAHILTSFVDEIGEKYCGYKVLDSDLKKQCTPMKASDTAFTITNNYVVYAKHE